VHQYTLCYVLCLKSCTFFCLLSDLRHDRCRAVMRGHHDFSGLEQVFDGNTDFDSRQIDVKPSASTCAAFQLQSADDVAIMNFEGSCENSNVEASIGHHTNNLIPYDKNLIKILTEKKKGSRAFCSVSSIKKEAGGLKAKEEVKIESDAVDYDDVISEASSDVSSILSLTSIQSLNGDFPTLRSMSASNSRQQPRNDLPDVHGGQGGHQRNKVIDAQLQMRKLNRQLDLVRSENEQYANLATQIPDYKQEVFSLKSSNFDLQREKANLKSQLDTALASLEAERQRPPIAASDDVLPHQQPQSWDQDHGSYYDSKAQLRKAHDEIYRLKTEATKLKLELRGRDDDLKRLEAKQDSLDNANLELSAANQKLTQKIREFEADLQSALRSKLAAEQSLSVLQSERESFVKSRNWYRDQMHSAQESRSEIQQELINGQSEAAAKSTSIQKLRLEIFQANETLEDEREKTLREKEELKRQLELLEANIRASPPEDTAGAEEASLVLSEDSGHDDHDEVELEILKDELRGKVSMLEILQSKLDEAIAVNEAAQMEAEAAGLKIILFKERQNEVETAKMILNEELAQKKAFLEDLKEAKISDEMMLSRLRSDIDEVRQSWHRELDNTKEQRNDLKKVKDKLDTKLAELEDVEVKMKHFKNEFMRSKTDLEDLRDVHQQNILLKKQLLSQTSKLSEENSQLTEAFSASDEARSALEHSLDAAKAEIEANKKAISHIEDSRKVDELASNGLNIANNKLEELEQLLNDKNRVLASLEVINSDLDVKVHNLERTLANLEASMSKAADSDDLQEDEDFKILQAQKISRVECSLKIYEAEISRLTSKINDLEEHVLGLEHKNGRLIMDSYQNNAMKNQIHQLQEDIAKDTALRRELLASLELAKSSLYTEIGNLERSLQAEKESHSETKNRLLLQEHECSTLRVDRRSLRTGLEAANIAIDNLNKTASKRPITSNITIENELEEKSDLNKELQFKIEELKEANMASEDARWTISGLEDQLAEVKFNLKQKLSEVNSLQSVLQVKDESYASEVTELRSKCDNLRLEIVNLSRKVDKLSEEKNSYRSQVQDMTIALKNSLEHIKRLRSSRPPTALSPSSITTLNSDDSEDNSWSEMLSSSKKLVTATSTASDSVQRQNLTNLQNCLASLKYEMAILQNKLAPSATNSPIKSTQQPLRLLVTTTTSNDLLEMEQNDDDEQLVVIQQQQQENN
jgi:chromosome segregation ATPase